MTVDTNAGFLKSPIYVPLNTVIYGHYLRLKNCGILYLGKRMFYPRSQTIYQFLPYLWNHRCTTPGPLEYMILPLIAQFDFDGFRNREFSIYPIGNHQQDRVVDYSHNPGMSQEGGFLEAAVFLAAAMIDKSMGGIP